MRLVGLAVVVVLCLVSMPLAAEAQKAVSIPRIGFLSPSSLSEPRTTRYLQAFRQGLRELGYVEGQNIAIELRWAEGRYDRLPGLAAELVRLQVNVIVTYSEQAIRAAKEATERIPIVMAAVADPVAIGFVAGLARPGGNITGVSNMRLDLLGKQLELLKEVVPKVSRVAILGNAAVSDNTLAVRHAQDAARALGVRLQPLLVRGPSEIDSAFAAMTTEGAGALIVLVGTMLLDRQTRTSSMART